MRGEAGLMADLAALGIEHKVYEHQAVFTVEASRAIKTDIPGAHTKNLFLKDKRGAFWLVTVPGEGPVDLKGLPTAIGCDRVSFGKPEDMVRLIGIEPGSVTPLAMINAVPGSVTCVIDAELVEDVLVNVHPLRNTASVGMAGADILNLLEHWGHVPRVAVIPKKEMQ